MKKFLFMAVAAMSLLFGGCDNGFGGYDDDDDDSDYKVGTHKMELTVTGSSDISFTYNVTGIRKDDSFSKLYLNGEYVGINTTKDTTIKKGIDLTFTTDAKAADLLAILCIGGENGQHAKIVAKSYVDNELTSIFERSYNFNGDFEVESAIITSIGEIE